MENLKTLLSNYKNSKEQTEKIIDEWFLQLRNHLEDTAIKEIAEEYLRYKNQKNNDSEILKIMLETTSPTFHGKIMSILLNPNEKHKEGNTFLIEFLKYLQDKHNATLNIDDYINNTEVSTEEGYVDIWLRNHTSRKCILIENNIKGIVTQHAHLANYYKKAIDQRYTVDAIVYITWTGQKPNDTLYTNCSTDEREKIQKLLINIAVYDNKFHDHKDLYFGWLRSCYHIASSTDMGLLIGLYLNYLKNIQFKKLPL